jgi:hypothetical protein
MRQRRLGTPPRIRLGRRDAGGRAAAGRGRDGGGRAGGVSGGHDVDGRHSARRVRRQRVPRWWCGPCLSGGRWGYRCVVSVEPAARRPLSPETGAAPRAETPRAIRDALLPEEAGQFDSEWRTAMSRSAESLDLAEVYTVLERWRGDRGADPRVHRRMLHRAERVLAGQERGMVTADDMRQMLARRLG